MKPLPKFIAIGLLLTTSACATSVAGTQAQRPIGPGTSPNSLRGSPCACIEQNNPHNLPAFLAPATQAAG